MADRRSERFLTTVLFTDIVGSTDLAAELGDKAWREMVQEHHRLVRAALKKYRGREIDTAGDGFFTIFDAPASAVECALDVARQVQALGLEIRAGLHVGEVEQSDGKVSGITVPIGSRIMAQAGPSEVLASATVRDLTVGAGFRYEDRGTRELKGVPGEWRLYAASRAADAAADGTAAELGKPDQAHRRASAVRRRQARPIWQRHPRAAAGVVAGLALAVVLAGLWIWQPWLPSALSGVAEDSVGIIDPARNVVIATAPVGRLPSAIAVGEGSVWVANAGDDTISQIDPTSRAVIDTIDVGREPSGIAVGAGSIWVADSGERSVARINAATRRVVDTIGVGNGPRAIAYGASGVWVANAGDATVTRIDPTTGAVGEPISLRSLPTAIAADDDGSWVVSADAGTVIHLDATGSATSAPLAVGRRPSAIAIGEGAIYVANSADHTISVIDPADSRVTAVIDVAGTPSGLAIDGRTLWVADRNGALERVDLDQVTRPHARIELGSAAEAVATVGGQPWVVTRTSLSAHRGGTLEVVTSFPTDVDPAFYPHPAIVGLMLDGLVGYAHVGGVAGSQLVANLAAAIPQPTDGGLTYKFKLRDGLLYSDGTPVRASDFRFALERVFQLPNDFGAADFAAVQYAALIGMEACSQPPVERCDLSAGIITDDERASVTFHLSQPDPAFLYHLAMSFATPLPPSVSSHEIVDSLPATGPYMVSSLSESALDLVRNPHFAPREDRPDGYVDAIHWRSDVDPNDGLRMVESGGADYIIDQLPADAFPALQTQYAQQLHIAPGSTTFVFMDTLKPPFDNVDARRALSMAIDRGHVAELRGGPLAAQPTCQVLPPNFPGFEPYCPYTQDPTPAGRWSAPDIDSAMLLVAQSGTAGSHVTVGPFVPRLTPIAEYVASVLTQLGYDVSLETSTDPGEVFEAVSEGRVMVGGFEWVPDFPAPDASLGQFNCGRIDNFSHYCGAELDALMEHARQIQATDPAAANHAWAEVDRRVTDLALWVPLVNEGSDLVSVRVGNYQFSPALGALLDQMWVQ